MKPACRHDGNVALYFYDELADRSAAEAHFMVCAHCRASLDDLRLMASALAAAGTVSAPSDGWAGCIASVDRQLPAPRVPGMWRALQLAAGIALVVGGAYAGLSITVPAAKPAATASEQAEQRTPHRAGDSELARAKVVLAGLAHKDVGEPWDLERGMAASLLPDVSLVRQIAAAAGHGDHDDLLQDIETLLLQAAYGGADDAAALEQLRMLIARRDLLMRVSLAASATEPATN